MTKLCFRVLIQGMVLHDQIENPCISFDFVCTHSLGFNINQIKIMGRHLVIITGSTALRDTDSRRRPRSVRISVRIYFIMFRAVARPDLR
jgi:hypothetical protein